MSYNSLFRFRLICDPRSFGQSVLVSGSHLGPMTRFLWLGHLRSSCYETLSLTRGRVCNLLLQFAITLQSKFRRTHDHILLSHLRILQLGGPGLCIYIPQEQGGPVIPPGSGFPFFSPLTTPNNSLFKFKFKFKLYCNWRSVSQLVLVSCPFWSTWPDFTFLWVTITFFLFHVGCPLRRKDRSVICSAMTQVQV
jgi:hypothetical protein